VFQKKAFIKQALWELMEYEANRDYRKYESEPTRTPQPLFVTKVKEPEPS
jgi:hypothetical protein